MKLFLAKIHILLFCLLTLISCGGSISPEEYKIASEKCKMNGGLKTVYDYNFDYYLMIDCNNGAHFEINKSELNE